MAERHGTSPLRYVAASDMPDDRIDFDGLDVRNAAGEQLGDVDGFVVDRGSGRPYYLVVDSGGWFSSRHYLVPIGHIRFDPDNEVLRVDFDRDTIRRFPEAHIDRFDRLTEEEARRFNEQTLLACCPTEVSGRTGEGWDYDAWSHYRQPDWWTASASTLPPPPLTNRPLAEDYDPTVRGVREVAPADRPLTDSPMTYEPDPIVARDTERPPGDLDRAIDDRPLTAPTDRAQPGDVLGIETGGETTGLGDTARDEDKRREDAEEAVRKRIEDDRKRARKDRG
jgi:hypothetical protein